MTAHLTAEDVVARLGFVLGIDSCARGCRHCAAFGTTAPVQRTPLDTLSRRLESLAAVRAQLRLPRTPERTVHCWRISDPLDYWSRTPGNGTATAADIALLWREHLHQGLYVVTNGSEGRRPGRQALAAFAAVPALVSQLKITITPEDQAWGTPHYVEQLADDLRLLMPLWDLPAARAETAFDDAARLRLNVKTTRETERDARAVTVAILREAGLTPAAAEDALGDRRRVAIKPIYDLGQADGSPSPVEGAIDLTDATGHRNKPTPGQRSHRQYGLRPDGRVFEVDLFAFTETDLTDTTGQPVYWREDPDHGGVIASG